MRGKLVGTLALVSTRRTTFIGHKIVSVFTDIMDPEEAKRRNRILKYVFISVGILLTIGLVVAIVLISLSKSGSIKPLSKHDNKWQQNTRPSMVVHDRALMYENTAVTLDLPGVKIVIPIAQKEKRYET